MILRKKLFLLSIILILAGSLAGCAEVGLNMAGNNKPQDANIYEVPAPGEYDSADTSIITRVSKINSTVSFYNYELAKSYTLEYDTVTRFEDKYGSVLSVDQLKEGQLVDIKFLKSKKLLVSLKESSEAFVLDDITGFSVDSAGKVFKYKSETYKLSSSTILIGGREDETIRSLSEFDNVRIVGIGSDIYSIIIKSGHGYLSLKNGDYFVDGAIQAGKVLSSKITKGMVLTLPEGETEISVSRNSTEYTQKVEIVRGQETVIDLKDVEIEEYKTGKVLFAVTPADANVYIDGVLIDNDRLYEYSYGLHKLVASATGYESLTRFFNVGEGMASLPVVLEEKESTEDKKEEEADHTEGYFIFVSLPGGVEISFDGNYIGVTPVSIKKKVGNHTITLRKNGYIQRTYNVLIENTAENVYYSFEELEKEKEITPPTSEETPEKEEEKTTEESP